MFVVLYAYPDYKPHLEPLKALIDGLEPLMAAIRRIIILISCLNFM